jgi:hypothetical protein
VDFHHLSSHLLDTSEDFVVNNFDVEFEDEIEHKEFLNLHGVLF